jgi:hypothetical protein
MRRQLLSWASTSCKGSLQQRKEASQLAAVAQKSGVDAGNASPCQRVTLSMLTRPNGHPLW